MLSWGCGYVLEFCPTAMNTKRPLFSSLALGATFVTTLFATDARADEVSGTGKGIVGGALLGAEVVTMTEAIIDLRSPWMYAVGGGVGAVGGGIGGYFVEQASSDGRAPLYMLGGGLALIIPAVVLTLNATRYRPTEGAREDKPVGDPPDPGSATGTSVIGADPGAASGKPASTHEAPAPTPAPSTTPAPNGGSGGGATPPSSLIDVAPRGTRMGVPLVEIRPVFSDKERKQWGMAQVSEVRVPVVRVSF